MTDQYDQPPAKCIICGRTSRIAGLLGSDVCSPACGWMDRGASDERKRIAQELRLWATSYEPGYGSDPVTFIAALVDKLEGKGEKDD